MLIKYILPDLHIKLGSVAESGQVAVFGAGGDYDNAIAVPENTLIRDGYLWFSRPVNWNGSVSEALEIAEFAVKELEAESGKVNQVTV